MQVFYGTPVSDGIACGRILKIDEKTDVYSVNDDSILLIFKSSPKWVIPLIKAGGIISEIGGYASHIAILSREMVKPCVSDINSIYSSLKNGDKVLIDGYKGQVVLYDD